MTGLMTPDGASVHASDTIARVQRRLFKASAKHPRRTAFAILLGLVKALALVAWLVSRQSRQPTRTSNVAPRDLLQSEEQLRASAPPAGLQDAFWRRHDAESSASLRGIHNEVLWRDTSGNVIQAHGGSVLFHEGAYYFYGEHKGGRTLPPGSGTPPSIVHRVDVIGISCYTSTDLINWKYEGLALPAGQHPDLDPSKVVERPRVLYNDLTQRFVMWMHIDTGDYELAQCGMATSASPTGPFTYIHSFRPHGHMCRDFTIFKDDDGQALIAYSSEANKVMHVARLTKDFTDVHAGFARTMVGMSREAPAMFKHGDIYLMITSGCTGWQANRAEVFYARDPLGEWESLGNPCLSRSFILRETTFHSQATHILPMPGQPGRFIFMADRWFPQALGMSRYIWLPMWVLDVPREEQEVPLVAAMKAQERARMRNRFRNLRPGATNMKSLPPVDVVVRWQQKWNLSALESPPPLCSDVMPKRPGSFVQDLECAL